MSADNLDEYDLRTNTDGDLVREDVLEKISQIDQFPLPFQSSIGRDGASRTFYEWTIQEKQAQDLTNAVVDGAAIDQDDSKLGERIGNHIQILVKGVKVSYGANASDKIGRSNEAAYQLSQSHYAMRRDLEGIMLLNQASVDPTDAVAGLMGGLPAFLKTPTALRGATGVDGGFNQTTKVVDAPTVGTPRGLTETLIRDAAQAQYEAGGNASDLMSTPTMIRKLSEYLFESTAKVATQTGNVSSTSNEGALVAHGSHNMFLTDFNVLLKLVPNRDQPDYLGNAYGGAGDVDVFLFDYSMIKKAVFRASQAERQGKKGLSEEWQISEYSGLKVLNIKSQGLIADVDSAIAVAYS